ncbi:DNA methyltransferase [Mesorhizobium sp. M0011]|uniref:Eco57I restriction-modification methylase domain-containing protein n=1 Tax=Mesorhizobium sp. M0011 TaxID=2956839 RepID=UPI00333A4EF0
MVNRRQLSEVQAEGALTQTFFVDTWGYGEAGRVAPELQTLIPKLRIAGEGAGGGPGEVDLAFGWFSGDLHATPQVLCEFKDIRSKLDAKQNRKGSNRSPVEQCLNYIRGARRGLFGNEPVQPWWGIVTDMNEFRLYWWDRAPSEYLRFVIRRTDLFAENYDLLTNSEDAQFDRFLFWKLFQRDYLLSQAGRPPLLRLIERQWVKERALEGEFYDRYKAVRERLFEVMRLTNPAFDGTPTELLRLSQALLDRFIFAFYCEDMGARMLFPPQMIRDHLKSRSVEPYYDPSGSEFWEFFKRLFAFMNEGGMFGGLRVPHINGGLFAANPTMNALAIPNHVFAAAKQGAGEAALESDRDTLLYLCARYNYASRGNVKESLSLYTLGRIFEQSITELEYRAGELEGRESVAKISKRKRDGVYYTPGWVVNLLVEQALGPWFAAARGASGYPTMADDAPDLSAGEAYLARLRAIRIVDPACGSGAFLISAFRRLLQERMAVDRDIERARGGAVEAAVSEAPMIADILANNIYGVDINPASVEIAKLALWLHSARADGPLSSLDHTIRCGNSLVGHDFWGGRERLQDYIDRINSFDWEDAFPEVWPDDDAEGGFDIVLGNPPYVKLQNLMKVDPEVVAYLQANRGNDTYVSAQTGNTDLYLPFIEKGLRLLARGGRMAYIAPSLWTVNQYGEGLRRLVRRTQQLDRWLDFKANQIFEEVTTYTALQFFTKEPREQVRIAVAPAGETEAHDVDWSDEDLSVAYNAFAEDGEWLMATGAERALIDRLARDCLRLDDASMTSGITVGIQTSADSIYHLDRIGSGRYRCAPKGLPAYEVQIEDAIMKSLVSGGEAKRYEEPETNTFLLFPYEREPGGAMRIISSREMVRKFPSAWAYLRSWEQQLRGRENNKFDDDVWYRFGRSQNIDKQDLAKLVVPRLVEHLKVSMDATGSICLDNVDVGGVSATQGTDLAYLMGVLNAPVADFVFRSIAKPFRGDYRSANKQFIAPLPIPNVSPEDRAEVATRARELQRNWTRRRELLQSVEERLSILARARHPMRWLWPDLQDLPEMIVQAPAALKLQADRRAWAEARLDELEASRLEALQAAIDGGGRLEVAFRDGELRLYAGGTIILGRIYLDDEPGRLTEAYWRWLFLSRKWREADRFAAELRRPPVESASPAILSLSNVSVLWPKTWMQSKPGSGR